MQTANFLQGRQVIIFDLDGTLIDSVGIWNELDWRSVHEMAGIDADRDFLQQQREQIIHQPNGGDVYATHRQFLIDYYHLPFPEAVVDEKRKAILKELLQQINYKPGAVKVLETLKARGMVLVLATTTSRWLLNKYEHLHLPNYFDYIFTTDDVQNPKPSPEIYFKVLNTLKIAPEKCLVVEDSWEGVTAGKAAQLPVLNMVDAHSQRYQAQINQMADYQLHSYAEFLSLLHCETAK